MDALNRLLLRVLLASLAIFFPLAALAAVDLVNDDTDLFTVNPNIPSQVPNVLIVVDNTSNWSRASQHWPSTVDADCVAAGITGNQQGDAEVCAIYKTVATLDEQINVGLMMFNDQDKGAYVRFPMNSMTSSNKTAFQTVLSGISTNNPGDKTSTNSSYDNPINDAFRYFNSFATFGGSGAASAAADVNGYTSTAKTNFNFLASTKDNSCGYDYIVWIGNGFPNAVSLSPNIDAAAALLNDSSVVVNKAIQQNTGVNTDVWSRFLFQYGVKVDDGVYRHITTYTLDVCKDQCEAAQATLLKSMASVSQGKYFKATDLSQIQVALKQIFQEVQAVNSVFAATTLPVSINVRGTNLNQVYIGVFRPDAARSPRWLGNLKQYKLGIDPGSGQLGLVDANDVQAVNLNTGFISNTATSIWTDPSTFWSYRSPYPQTDAGGASDSPDGDLVEKGGAAEKIRTVYATPDSATLNADGTSQSRNLYTCTGSCAAGSTLCSTYDATKNLCTAGYLFNTANANITAQSLGTFATTPVDSLSGSGSTATATILAGHTFTAGQSVVIAGAVPSFYNGTVTVLASPAPTTTQFSYSISPNTADTTHGYLTFSSGNNTLSAGFDKITVTASDSTYNVTAAALSGVVGNVNQLSYPLPGPTFPTAPASGYTVTAVRFIDSAPSAPGSSKIIWSNSPVGLLGNGTVTVTLSNHGYSSGDAVAISGANETAFDVPGISSGIITKVDANTFTYEPNSIPSGAAVTTGIATTLTAHGFSAGDTVVVCGTTAASGTANQYDTATSSCTTSSGSSITNVGATTFSYTVPASLTALTALGGTARRRVAADRDDYTVTAVSVGSGSNKDKITLTISGGLTGGNALVSGQSVHTLAVGDKIAVQGVNCVAGTCTTTTSAPSPSSSSPPPSPYTVAVTAVDAVLGKVTFSAGANNNSAPSLGTTPRVYWTGTTFSTPVTVASVAQGAATVKATGTIYASKSGDFTTRVTAISSQGSATGSVTAAASGSADPAEHDNLIAWVRGADNKDNENLNNDATDIRASVHADVLHSRPAVVNYNRNGDENDVYVFYGANDGMLHAVKGASEATGGGKEEWAFVPQEFFGKLKRLRDQSPSISSVTPRDYFFDGPIGVYTLDANRDGKLVAGDGDKVYLYIAMRRGGRKIFAFDVSDPVSPKFMWSKGCSNPTGSGATGGCDTGFDEIGQTWSQPQLAYLRKWPTTLALIFGAGYDNAVEDPQSCYITDWNATSVTYKAGVLPPTPMGTTTCPPSGGTSTTVNRSMGRGVFILNAVTGDILWRAGPDAAATKQVTGMDYAIAADLAILRNRNNTGGRTPDIGAESVPTGYVDRIYAADTGGQMWRLDVSDTSGATASDPPAFVVTKLASVAEAPATGQHAALNYRKFLFSPDVVYSSDLDGAYDAVLLGSGDREHPFDMVVVNRFYMFKDRNIGNLATADVTSPNTPPATITDSASSTDLFDVTNNCLQTAANCDTAAGQTQVTAQTALRAAKGWKLTLANLGEKTIATATTAAGSVIFNTNQPKQDTVTGQSSSACTSDLGTARQYGIDFQDATATNIFSSLPAQYVEAGGRSAEFAGGGFLPTPVPVVVQIDGKYYQTVISGVQTTNPGGLKLQSRLRTYWYRKTD